jgi:hypothetical protein
MFEDAGDGAAPEGWDLLPLELAEDPLNWPDIQSHRDRTSSANLLHQACFRRAESVFLALVLTGIDINMCTKATKSTALHCVVHAGNKNTDEQKARYSALLVLHNIDTQLKDNRKRAALHWTKVRGLCGARFCVRICSMTLLDPTIADLTPAYMWSNNMPCECLLPLPKRKLCCNTEGT